jgi:hypothetical protein
VYQRALLRHLAGSGRSSGDAFAASLISTIDCWGKNSFYRALHSSVAELAITRAIGIEFSGEEGKGLESIWMCETGQGVTVASLRNESMTLSRIPAPDGFKEVWDMATEILPVPGKSDVHIARNALHATSYSIVLVSDAGVSVKICYDLPDDRSLKIAHLISALQKLDDGIRRSSIPQLK